MLKFFILLVKVLVFFVIIRVALFYTFPLAIADGEKVHFTATIFDDSKILGKTQRLTVRFETFWQGVPITVATTAERAFSYRDSMKLLALLNTLC